MTKCLPLLLLVRRKAEALCWLVVACYKQVLDHDRETVDQAAPRGLLDLCGQVPPSAIFAALQLGNVATNVRKCPTIRILLSIDHR